MSEEEEKVTPLVAQRMVQDIERQAAFEWRMAGSLGSKEEYVDRALRERLAEALAEPDELRAQLSDINGAFLLAKDEIEKIDPPDDMDGDFGKILNSTFEKHHEHFVDLIKRLVARVEDQSNEIARLKEEEPKQTVQIVKPLARSPRARLGSTTMVLPGLGVASNDVQIDEPDVPKVGSVKRGRKSA